MKRHTSLAGEMAAGLLAGLASLGLAVAFLAIVVLIVPQAAQGLRFLLAQIDGGLRSLFDGLPRVAGRLEAVPGPALAVIVLGLGAALAGLAFAAVVQDVRASASVAFWAGLTGLLLAAGVVMAIDLAQPAVLTVVPAGTLFVAAALYGLGLRSIVVLRRWLKVPYEPQLATELPPAVVQAPAYARRENLGGITWPPVRAGQPIGSR